MAAEIGVGVATEVASEVATSLGAKIIKHVAYVFQYNGNLNILKDAQKKLSTKRQDSDNFVQKIEAEQRNVSKIVHDWNSEADVLSEKAQELISGNKVSCLNLCSRYSASKRALELADEISKKVQNEPHFGNVFDRPPLTLGAKLECTGGLEGFREFQSRVSVMNQVWDALKDKDVRMLSICGMGGTGKTTLARKLIQRLESDRLFDMVSIATVSQNPNPRKIRAEIVSNLGWKFESNELETPDKLLNSLSNNDKRILLILDDVKDKVDFAEIGIPKTSLKIMLTSREQSVCERMGSQWNFVINVLTKEEARCLFKEIAKETIDELKLHKKAEEIADQCGGLPLVIVPLATALKNEVKATWNDSLLKLKNSNARNIPELDKVYSRIWLSYDLLNDDEAKSCFRLCSLFPEDHNVPVESLVFIGKGLQLFNDVDTMSDTRDRVVSIINKLKKSFLLLDGEEDDTVKMHDTFRDFAIHISSKDHMVRFGKVMEKWPESSEYENCSVISLVYDEIKDLPDRVRCPNLKLLQLVFEDGLKELPIGIFEELKELKVLVLFVPYFLQSLTMLKELRTLIISCENARESEIGRTCDLGVMTNLEILEFNSDMSFGDFPKEIGMMCKLRCLRFEATFKYMPPGLLSKLVKLEELELSLKFHGWGRKEEGGERMNASLDDIKSLPLTTLKINAGNCSNFPQELVKSLKRFHVCMGNYLRETFFTWSYSDASLELFNVDAYDDRGSGFFCLWSKCEHLRLEYVRNLKKFEDIEFPQTREPFLETEISWARFSNLSHLNIRSCYDLKYLFPLSVAIELKQLQSINISYCESIEKILSRNHEDGGNEQVLLESSTTINENPRNDDNPQGNCGPKRVIVESTTTTISVDDNPQSSCCPIPNSFIGCFFRKEKHPKTVSTPQIMEENIAKVDRKENDHSITLFPQLNDLELYNLPKLRIFFDGNQAIKLPSLENVSISNCNEMEGLSYGSLKAPRLETIQIDRTYYAVTAGEDLNAIVKREIFNLKDDDGDDGDEICQN